MEDGVLDGSDRLECISTPFMSTVLIFMGLVSQGRCPHDLVWVKQKVEQCELIWLWLSCEVERCIMQDEPDPLFPKTADGRC